MYPRMVYKSASVHQAVNNDAQHAAALKDGWYASVPEALAGAHSAAPVAAKTDAEKKANEKSAQVAEIMADLKTKTETEQKEYALALGIDLPKKADAAQILIAIEKALHAA